ncbi:N-acetyl-gamma-glutamyl-phosphate reductase [Thermogemmatispora sp.]|uniref:N-acetyl-gamma-glutamyl-phosphate reductase n=1 Tax=Thermogemmatispora sp. TaxID=1968838 RepID=UPI0035E4564D
MISVSIVNVTGYTGLELLRLLANHPHFQVTSVTGRSAAGQRLGQVFPQLYALAGGACQQEAARHLAELVITEEPEQTELAFVCLPHAAAAEAVVTLLQRGTRVVDLSADFRLRDPSLYQEWYRHTHPAPALLEQAVYGLCERYRERIRATALVANPGCYATAIILALLPALSAGLVSRDLIVDAKSGVSGAGRGLRLDTHYAEANEDLSAYSLGGHRHWPEIVQELQTAAQAAGQSYEPGLRLTFVPHLTPMTRGILATCYAELRPDGSGRLPDSAQVQALYRDYYAGEPFVHVIDQPPHTKWTYGSNHCLLYVTVDERSGRLLVLSCLDNLVKGASGQAIQNANCMFGFDERCGLQVGAIYP